MSEKGTLRMARQELEDLYLGVPDNSVDLTFRDLILPPPPSTATVSSSSFAAPSTASAIADDDDDDERNSKALLRSSTNIFTYKLAADHLDVDGNIIKAAAGHLELPPSPPPPAPAIVVAAGGRRSNKQQKEPRPTMSSRGGNYKRPGIPHSNICALCTNYVYLFRQRCLVCGRVYCRRCVAAGMGDMTEGRKCIDCLGRRYSHRYIHRAGGGSGCYCFWGYPNANSVKAQELVWAEKGPAPRRRPRPSASTSIVSTSYSAAGGGYSAAGGGYSASMSMSMTMNNSTTNAPPAPAAASSRSFVASFSRPNPHAFPL